VQASFTLSTFENGETYVDLGEPFRNDRAIVGSNANFKDDAYSTGNAVRASDEMKIDSNGNGIWDQAGDGQYNGVLRAAAIDLDKCVDGTVLANTIHTFPLAIRDDNDTVFVVNSKDVTRRPYDLPGNPLPAGTTISFSASNGSIVSGNSFVVPSIDSASCANWIYPVQMISDVTQIGTTCRTNSVRNGLLRVTVRTPNGVVSTASYGMTD
jgi:hypothetical protein